MNLQYKHIFFVISIVFAPVFALSQCNNTVNFNVSLSGTQSTSQSVILNGTLTSVQFNLNFSAGGAEWPADMIVGITAPNGNCMSGEGFNVTPPSGCTFIDFPPGWTTTANGFYTYTMPATAANLSGSGNWNFFLQNGYTAAGATSYILEIVLIGICDQGGCMNQFACNFDPNAAFEDNSLCEYALFGYDCNGVCIADTDGDGICDVFEVLGCTDMAACNFSLLATDEDGSCTFAIIDQDCIGNSLSPTLSNPPPNMTASCNNIPPPPTVYASISSFASQYEEDHNPNGNCYAGVWTVTVVMDESTIPGDCPGRFQIIRHWVGTDCMNRTVEHTQTIDVVDNTPPSFTSGVEAQTITCPMAPNFNIALAEDICSGPVTYQIAQETSIPGICAGTYTKYRLVTATDACGNSSTVEQVINVEDTFGPVWTDLLPEQVISADIATQNFGMPVAFDLCSDVSVEVTSSVGSGLCPLSIELTRTFIAFDACGNASDPFIQIINEPTDLTATYSTSDALCFNTNDGSITVTPIGGVGPYEMFWGNNDPNNLQAGDYSVTVSDANLCSTTLGFTISSPPGLQLSLESTPPLCTDPSSGIIVATSGGGTGELIIDWGLVNPLAASSGDYLISLTDINGCSISTNVIVDSAPIPVNGVLLGDTEVMMGDSSSYEFTYTAGSTYDWTFTGADSLVVSNLFAISLLWTSVDGGTVCVQETNASGCVGVEVCLPVNVTVGLDELTNDMNDNGHVLTYPNPSTGLINCMLPVSMNAKSWKLIDVSGANLLDGKLVSFVNPVKLDLSSISSGRYVLLFNTQDGNYTTAVPIQIQH